MTPVQARGPTIAAEPASSAPVISILNVVTSNSPSVTSRHSSRSRVIYPTALPNRRQLLRSRLILTLCPQEP